MRRNFLKLMAGGSALAVLAACGGAPSKFRSYNGPPVTMIQVDKRGRRMHLLSGNRALKSYNIGLGFAPVGHKYYEGDGKTPEGMYYIDRRNPNSMYHLSLGISYPNEQDRARALAMGRDPGRDIFIHGQGPEGRAATRRDWTVGCIAVTDAEMEEIYSMIGEGTPIYIGP
ncbi:MAG: L,D-transpeptidase family protein [Paracoccus sp. (in: a-proteobacteria)]|nr:L,D-transpeptidase family protein [Paracoccus sp. (in: a-proteobacteria)]